MYHQTNPTETFRERQLALLKEAENRRLARRLRTGRGLKARSRTAAALGFLAALLVAIFLLAASPAHASTTFTVDDDFADATDLNPGDGVCDVDFGAEEVCTLRAAIQEANLAPGADTINFNITRFTDEIATISPESQLPDITDRVTIDGYSEPGAKPNTLAQGTNAVLKIELVGADAGSLASGLVIESGGSGSVVKGLAIRRFDFSGIILRPDSTQNRIEGNFIGTDLGGTFDEGNGSAGVQLFKSNTSASNTIGGNSPAARNLISGNNGIGVGIFESTNNLVAGNLIGTKKDAITALGNSNGGVGISSASNNTISGNTIAFNGGDGVGIFSIGTGNLLAGNSIVSNVEEGIDLGLEGVTANDPGDQDTGANTLQNKPLITSAKTSRKATTIKGTLNSTPSKSFIVQFFSNASGGEGQRFIGQTGLTTDTNGNAYFTFKPALKVRKGKITATATETVSKNTSEFSAAKKVVRPR